MFAALAKAVKDAGGSVVIVHGACKDMTPAEDLAQAKAKLSAAGFDGLYDDLVVADRPRASSKAMYCRQAGVDLFIDNRKKNAKRVSEAGIPAARFLS